MDRRWLQHLCNNSAKYTYNKMYVIWRLTRQQLFYIIIIEYFCSCVWWAYIFHSTSNGTLTGTVNINSGCTPWLQHNSLQIYTLYTFHNQQQKVCNRIAAITPYFLLVHMSLFHYVTYEVDFKSVSNILMLYKNRPTYQWHTRASYYTEIDRTNIIIKVNDYTISQSNFYAADTTGKLTIIDNLTVYLAH